jgi:CelD/BcsL family acetyltransferase involved in cellulose biosynthesis
MNLAVLPISDRRVADGTHSPSVLARTQVLDDLGAAEPLWRRLEQACAAATPYQRLEWVAHWYRHVGRANGAVPLIVVGFDRDDAPQFIFPLITERRHGVRVATFFGGTHSNLNMPIWTDASPPISPRRGSAISSAKSPRRAASICLRWPDNCRPGGARQTRLPRCAGNPPPTTSISASSSRNSRRTSRYCRRACARKSAS